MNWISLTDLCAAAIHAIGTESLSGAVNSVSPLPVTNAEFTWALGSGLHGPTILPLPAFAARILLGEMADALLLASTRVEPARLQASGFVFQHREIRQTLQHILHETI